MYPLFFYLKKEQEDEDLFVDGRAVTNAPVRFRWGRERAGGRLGFVSTN